MWGATPGVVVKAGNGCDFNPRTPMWGATFIPAPVHPGIIEFQSAHPYVGCDKISPRC